MSATDKKYLKLVDAWNAAGAGIVDEPIDYYTNWWQISWDEAAQFGITPSLNNALCLAYTRAQNMMDMTDSGDLWTERDAQSDRKHYPLYAGNPPSWDAVAATRFMSEVCQLPYRECAGYMKFVINAMDRAGLIEYAPRYQ